MWKNGVDAVYWSNLRTTYGVPPFSGFDWNPRTLQEALDDGWQQVGGCGDGSGMLGERYARSAADNSMVVIFDAAGFVAGHQSVVPVDKTFGDQYYNFAASPMYERGMFFDQEVYFTTAYFVDPELICTTGRTQDDFDNDGTGDRLVFQAGEGNYLAAPLTEQEAIDGDTWYKHWCFVNMGNHFFQMDPAADPDSVDCKDLFPVQLVYHLGDLNAFVWQHLTPLDGDRWEHPNALAVGAIVNNAPTCMTDMIDDPGQSTMHVYVNEYIVLCILDDEK